MSLPWSCDLATYTAVDRRDRIRSQENSCRSHLDVRLGVQVYGGTMGLEGQNNEILAWVSRDFEHGECGVERGADRGSRPPHASASGPPFLRDSSIVPWLRGGGRISGGHPRPFIPWRHLDDVREGAKRMQSILERSDVFYPVRSIWFR
jgi:hypothetical protein